MDELWLAVWLQWPKNRWDAALVGGLVKCPVTKSPQMDEKPSSEGTQVLATIPVFDFSKPRFHVGWRQETQGLQLQALESPLPLNPRLKFFTHCPITEHGRVISPATSAFPAHRFLSVNLLSKPEFGITHYAAIADQSTPRRQVPMSYSKQTCWSLFCQTSSDNRFLFAHILIFQKTICL